MASGFWEWTAGNGGPNREIFRIAQIDRMRIFVNVPQTYASLVRAGQRAERLEQDRPHGRAHQSRERCVGRVLAALKELGCQPRAEPGAEDDPGQREGGRDEPLLPTDEGRQGDEAERDQVDFGHTVGRLLVSSDSWDAR